MQVEYGGEVSEKRTAERRLEAFRGLFEEAMSSCGSLLNAQLDPYRKKLPFGERGG